VSTSKSYGGNTAAQASEDLPLHSPAQRWSNSLESNRHQPLCSHTPNSVAQPQHCPNGKVTTELTHSMRKKLAEALAARLEQFIYGRNYIRRRGCKISNFTKAYCLYIIAAQYDFKQL
jgi:hypothetical protein